MSAKAYMALPMIEGLLLQLINGVVVVRPSHTVPHQRLLGELYAHLRPYTTNADTFISWIDLTLDERNVFQPDLMLIREGSGCRIVEGYPVGPPELVIEILAPETLRYDRVEKFLVYERTRVPELWLVDGTTQRVEVWRHNGKYLALVGSFGPGHTFYCPVFDTTLNLTNVWTDAES